jgi:dihydrofolate synthase/folylpolyglutamate synthase
MTFKNLHIVFGMVKDKEVSKILHLLPVNARYYFTQAQIPRALNAKYLQEQAAIFKLYGSTYENVNDALKEANSKALENDLIIVCGSIFLVAEVDRALFSKTQFA